MRVVSWNIAFGIEIAKAVEELSTISDLVGADILLLQEMDEAGTEAIADAIGGSYAYTSARPHDRTGRDFGNAIVSRWPMRNVAEVDLPGESVISGHPRSATRALLAVQGVEVLVYSVHTEIPSMLLSKRSEQFRTVARDANERDSSYVVVGGDFNTVTQRGVRALEEAMGLADLERISTDLDRSFRRGGRDIPLDHVFAKGFDVAASGVARSAVASDHLPLWVEISWTANDGQVES